MHRKILAICAGLVALGAFVMAPAMASAATTLRDTEGLNTVNVKAGEKTGALIVAYNTKPAKFTASGLNVACDEVTITGRVHRNDHTRIEGTIEHAYFRGSRPGTACESNLGDVTVKIPALTQAGGTSHWCIKTVAGTHNWLIDPRNCTAESGGSFTFILEGPLTCYYSRTASIAGHFTTPKEHKGSDLTLSEKPTFTKEAPSSIFCPNTGVLEEFEFGLFTDTDPSTPGTWTHAGSVGDPIWFEDVK